MTLAIAFGAFGSVIGSFLNVVIYRVPQGRSIVSPPSACGNCGHPVRARDNVPVFSWLALRGRCRDCQAPISARYPLVELGSGLFFALVLVRFLGMVTATQDAASAFAAVIELIAYLYLAAISVALALIDLDTRRLPNAIVLPAYAVGAVLFTSAAALTGEWQRVIPAVAGLALLGGLYLVLAVVKPGGMGFGDVKLACVLGLFLGWLGWDVLAVGALAGFVLGGAFALVLVAARKASRSSSVPFGPWMLAGAWLAIFIGGPLAAAYLALFGLGGS